MGSGKNASPQRDRGKKKSLLKLVAIKVVLPNAQPRAEKVEVWSSCADQQNGHTGW